MKTTILLLIGVTIASCGVRVSSPMSGGGSSGGNGGGSGVNPEIKAPDELDNGKTSVEIPNFKLINFEEFFTVPSGTLQNGGRNDGKGGNDNPNDTEAQKKVRDIDEILQQTSDLLNEIASSGQLKVGVQTDLGSQKNISTVIREFKQDGYAYQLTICEPGKKTLSAYWQDSQESLKLVGEYPTKDPEDSGVFEITLEDAESRQLVELFVGESIYRGGNQGGPENGTKSDVTKIERLNNGVITIAAVESGFVDGPPPASFGGEEYLVGAIAANGTSEFVFFDPKENGCENKTFDEANPTDSWCAGGSITDSSVVYDTNQVQAAAVRQQSIPLIPGRELKFPQLDNASDCVP